ncbi:MAG: hypothetical protein ABIP90_10995 [Vicinamibacterales bacterium]
MSRQGTFVVAAVFLAVATASAGCHSVDLKTQVEVVDISSGYYDNGLTAAGLNHLVPSITFSVRNISDREVSSIDMVVMYWAQGQDAEQDETLLKVVAGSGLPAGATSEPIVSRSKIGFTSASPRAELFNHSLFRDWTVKMFLKRGGKIVPAGEYKVEHRLLLSAPSAPK